MHISATLQRGESLGDRILKVNHAGEHGAVNIYRGQIFISRLLWPRLVPDLVEFKSHEEGHRKRFWLELQRRGRSRCRSYHLCGLGGLALGLLTGLLGPSAIAATTVAVERVVLTHLEAQCANLVHVDHSAHEAVSAIMAEEKSHHDRAQVQGSENSVWRILIAPVVAVSTESVIWLGMHL